MILHAPIVALLMRVKGGGPDTMPAWFLKLDGSIVSSFGYAALCGISMPWYQALACGLAWFAANAPSIGEEIGAIGGYRGDWFSDRDGWIGGRLFDWVRSDKLWGWCSLTLRGVYSGALLGLAAWNPWFLLAGLLMAPCYYIGVSIRQWETEAVTPPSRAWAWSEWIWGGVIGCSMIL